MSSNSHKIRIGILCLAFVLTACKKKGGNGQSSPTPTPPPNTVGCGITDSTPRPPGHIDIPAKGASYVDPVFGCTIRRLSDARKEGWAHVEHFYSSVNAFNSNQTKIITVGQNGVVHIRDLQGNIVRNNLNTFGILPVSDVSWSRSNPNILYFHEAGGNRLMSYDAGSNTSSVLHTFSNYNEVAFGLGEGDISWDGNHLAVIADNRWGFIFTISTKSSTRAVDLKSFGGGLGINWVDITPGNQFMAMFNPGGGKTGIYIWDQNMNGGEQVTDFPLHADRTKDSSGTDFFVMTNSADPSPGPSCPNGQVSVDLDDMEETCLQPLDWNLATHTSCNNAGQEWCVTSTYANGLSPDSWPAFANEIFKVNFDGSPSIRLAHTRSSNSSYERTPRASVSADGRYVLFTSDMDGVPDVYLLILNP